MVECASLENWSPCKRTAGSNPAPSAGVQAISPQTLGICRDDEHSASDHRNGHENARKRGVLADHWPMAIAQATRVACGAEVAPRPPVVVYTVGACPCLRRLGARIVDGRQKYRRRVAAL